MLKVMMYCQVGRALDMAKFSIGSALSNIGLDIKDCGIVFICWKTSPEVYDWLNECHLNYVDMEYDEGKGFLWNLYKGWNLGYEIGFQHADYVCPIATDHAFYANWLANMMKHARPNRIVNCKLIEPGTLPTLHETRNFGLTLPGEFDQEGFNDLCRKRVETTCGVLAINNDPLYGHRLDAMPFVCPRDVWKRFGPMNQGLNQYGITGDTDFFDRCARGGVEITKALDAISYHCGGLETRRNEKIGIYT